MHSMAHGSATESGACGFGAQSRAKVRVSVREGLESHALRSKARSPDPITAP